MSAQLYTVHFTTKQVVSQFDSKGVKTGEYEIDYPQTLHALPHSTAMTYNRFGNFRMEPYYASVSERPMSASKARTTHYGATPNGKKSPTPARSAPSGKSIVNNAAATGNLAAALNAGAK